MGRYNFAAQNVQKQASQLLHAKRIPAPPAWYDVIGTTPPSTRLVRQPMQRAQEPGKRPPKKRSRMFQPLNITYQEDNLRWEYFNDHPWELARPRVVLENDGRDHEKWDWSVPLDASLHRPKAGSMDQFGRRADLVWDRIMVKQSGRPINGESVVQRQNHLLRTGMAPAAAYDKARKELYRVRHAQETELRVAREEALATGAYFGPGPLQIGMQLEDKAYEDWKVWAEKEIVAAKQLSTSAYTGTENEDADLEIQEPQQEELQEVSSQIPATNAGQTAQGGAAVHP
ncbi:hypothetical protein PRZ48_012618 [Zasmidium cellare]|uniref:Small ribosomal subunit protein mS23 n=1 Tax=Zasmidium cellare TaxID=395010 RepID=A0ABR0E5C6_ZASCE|nr:hypothetical protein PRZ48_012618 [Zasmidium cellare]